MRQRINVSFGLGLSAFFMLLILSSSFNARQHRPDVSPTLTTKSGSYIVQAVTAATAERLVNDVGGVVTATLNIINAVGANLDDTQLERLRSSPGIVRVHLDRSLEVSGYVADTHFPTLVGASTLHKQEITGKGVTIAVIDTGLWKTAATEFTADGHQRVLAAHDAILDETYTDCDDYCGGEKDEDRDDERDDDEHDDDKDDERDDDEDDDDKDDDKGDKNAEVSLTGSLDDWNGHGTHITSIMVSSEKTSTGRYQGVAPNANVVAVRAFEPDGSGTYLNVIKALDWIVAHRRDYDIRIINLSFGADAASHYWDDPVNQAVMQAWAKGIIVVTAAGNSGPGPMTIGVPANIPYVITVGAVTDNFTPDNEFDDRLATFSAAGPTAEGFVKPDLVAPGGHMLGRMPPYAWLSLQYPDFVQADGDYFRMSGTSQSAAVVSGVLALMLEADPSLSPDNAKCRLMASARTAYKGDGMHAYSVFQQGAGLVDAVAAIDDETTGCANRGMYAVLDIWGVLHYAGPAGIDDEGSYYVAGSDGLKQSGGGFEWREANLWRGGATWERGTLWNDGARWNRGVYWQQASSLNADSLMNQGSLWPEGSLWLEGLKRQASTYLWVGEQ